MARSTTNKLYRNFVAGLITEASPLTYPENTSFNEDNCIIFKKGNRTRRLGLEYESGYVLSSHECQADDTDVALKEFTWFAVGNDAAMNFLVSQVGETIYFYDLSPTASSSSLKSFTIDLSAYKAAVHPDVSNADVEFTAGRGLLFIAGKKIAPLVVEYDADADTIAVSEVTILIRDFDGLDDGLANDEEPLTLTPNHHYNLRNQGWIDSANTGTSTYTSRSWSEYNEVITYTAPGNSVITEYFDSTGRYPGNNKQWWVGKLDADDDDKGLKAGDFDPDLLEREYFGNTHAPKGHYILNAMSRDRTAVSGVVGLTAEARDNRPETASFYAGRVWFAESSDVYFSQVLAHKRQAGFCYQDADPTAESISDLLDSDGGHIPIPEARRILRLRPSGNGMLVFATNGVWYISGTNAGFTASDYSVSKISGSGLLSPNSIVEAGAILFWWGQTGIQAIQQQSGMFGPVAGSFEQQNLSQETIQTLYNDTIPAESKPYVKGMYDPAANLVQWIWASDEVDQSYFYDRVLNYDLTLKAFYPWSISGPVAGGGPYLAGFFQTPNVNQVSGADDVYDGVNAVISGGEQVIANSPGLALRNRLTKFIVAAPTGSDSFVFTHGLFSNASCADWEIYSGDVGYAYTSFVETGFELFDDAMRNKKLGTVFCYFRRSEQNFVASGDDYTVDFPSSCSMQVKWDWSDTATSGRWSREVEAYRLSRVPPVDTGNLAFDNGSSMVITKNKVRGHGRAIQFRFSNSKIGSNFDLLGWAAEVSGETSS